MKEPDALIIVGDREFAEIAYEYFTHDSPYEVVAFSVEKDYLKKTTLLGLPVVPFEELEHLCEPTSCNAFVAVTYGQLNRVRARLYKEVRRKGFRPVSYVSSKAFVWKNAEIGDNCFIFEHNVIQYNVKIMDNVILWSGNQVAHSAIIRENAFLASQVVVSGYSEIGENCFLGANSSIADSTKIARDCIIGAGAVVIADTEKGRVYVGNPAKPLEKDSYTTFGVPEDLI